MDSSLCGVGRMYPPRIEVLIEDASTAEAGADRVTCGEAEEEWS